MKLVNRATEFETGRVERRRPFAAALPLLQRTPRRGSAFTLELLSPPPNGRERSSANALRITAPAPEPGGDAERQMSRLREANREWFIWRFGEDA